MGNEICDHTKAHYSVVNIIYLIDSKKFMADVTIYCKDCNMPFRFIGLPLGFSTEAPHMDPMGYEARMPIGPADKLPAPIMAKLDGNYSETKQ